MQKQKEEIILGKKITIRDIAKAVGVSAATASRALNDPDYPVSSQIRQKVREAASELGYLSGSEARSLRQKVQRNIGLVIPNLSNPFYQQAIIGINDILMKTAYNLILCSTMHSVEQEQRYLNQLYEQNTGGIILSSVDRNSDAVRSYVQKGMKFVLLDQIFSDAECPGIQFDSRAGARMAVEYLLECGHRTIAFATQPMTRWTRNETHRGYKDALLAAGIAYDGSLIYESGEITGEKGINQEFQTGSQIAERFLADGSQASAILCNNDMIAIGIIKTFFRRGVRVPEDISVMGFDDIPFASAFLPALTTIHYPVVECGRLAAMMLLDILDNGGMEMAMNMTPSLVVRDTVAKK